MTDIRSCRTCGAPAGPESTVGGLCPACLLGEVLHRADGTSPFTLAPDTTLGPFRIGRLIGKGGMAAVYKAHEGPPLERTIALKVLPPEFLHDDSFGKRFINEARLVANLEHGSIVPIYASGIDDGVPWISMRLLTGGTLSAELQHGPIGVERTVSVLRDIAGALAYAHARGVIHRDIKPSNILLDEAGRAYICDFGLARLLEPVEHWTRTGTMLGTPHYMSPEQAAAGNVDERSDVYSLGVVAFEMLTGSLPFTGETPIAVLLQHASAPVPAELRQRCPESMVVAIQKALAKTPDQRWESTTAFVNALQRGATGLAQRRLPRVAAAAAVFALTAAAAGTWWITRDVPSYNGRQDVASDTPRGPENEPPAGGPPGAGPDEKSSVSKPPIKDVATANPDPTAGGRPTAGDAVEGKPVIAAAGDREPVTEQTLQAVQPVTPQPSERVQQNAEAAEERDREQKVLPRQPIVTPPELLTEVKRLQYPQILLAAAQKGAVPARLQVVLSGTVGEDGQVTGVTVFRGSKEPLVDEAARKEFLKFRYKPALRDGIPVPYDVQQTFLFESPGR